MMRTCFLAISILSISAYAETGATPDWTGYYMLARDRDAAGLNIVSPDFSKTIADHLQPCGRNRKFPEKGVPGTRRMPAGWQTAPVSSAMPLVSSIFSLAHGCKWSAIVLLKSGLMMLRPAASRSR